jgi:metal-sulfur cluster biosynthetic enzyme
MNVTVEQVFAALELIEDPCSVSAGVPLSIREMGLVQDVQVSPNGDISIVLRLSSPGCLMGGFYFEPQITKRVNDIPGVSSISISFGDPLTWSEADISAEGRLRLDAARSRRTRPSEAVGIANGRIAKAESDNGPVRG